MIKLVTQASLLGKLVSQPRPITPGSVSLLYDGNNTLLHSPNLPGNVFWLDPSSLYKQGVNFRLGISASNVSGVASPVEVRIHRNADSKWATKVDTDLSLVAKVAAMPSTVLSANLQNAEIDLNEFVPLIVFTFTAAQPGMIALHSM